VPSRRRIEVSTTRSGEDFESKRRRRLRHAQLVAGIKWRFVNDPEWADFAKDLEAVAEAQQTLSELAPTGAPMEIKAADQDVYLTVEDFDRPGDSMDVLLARFGATPEEITTLAAAEIQVINKKRLARARLIHSYVAKLLDIAERDNREVKIVDDVPPAEPQPAKSPAPPRLQSPEATLAIIRYMNRRAPELGFPATEFIRKQQGTRNAAHAALKDGRAIIVAELCDELGASLAQVARVFGRQRSAIAALRDRGREVRKSPTTKPNGGK